MRTLEYTTPEEVLELNAEPWQIEVLTLNPEYVYWGNNEDYMSGGKGWNEAMEIESVNQLFEQDDLNEIVHFYFQTTRESRECEHCGQTGLNPKTKSLADSWFSFDNDDHIQNPLRPNQTYNRNAWQYFLTQVEVDALWDGNRLHHDFKTKPTAEQVNQWNLSSMGHDAINRSICVQARAKHQGVYGLCEHCHGNGTIYTSDKASTSLQLWVLHPRKGCSRGLLLNNIKETDLPEIFRYLKKAQQRSFERFSKIPEQLNSDKVAV